MPRSLFDYRCSQKATVAAVTLRITHHHYYRQGKASGRSAMPFPSPLVAVRSHIQHEYYLPPGDVTRARAASHYEPPDAAAATARSAGRFSIDIYAGLSIAPFPWPEAPPPLHF